MHQPKGDCQAVPVSPARRSVAYLQRQNNRMQPFCRAVFCGLIEVQYFCIRDYSRAAGDAARKRGRAGSCGSFMLEGRVGDEAGLLCSGQRLSKFAVTLVRKISKIDGVL